MGSAAGSGLETWRWATWLALEPPRTAGPHSEKPEGGALGPNGTLGPDEGFGALVRGRPCSSPSAKASTRGSENPFGNQRRGAPPFAARGLSRVA